MPAGSKVLIAEDNAALGNVLKFNLERANFAVTLVNNGLAALEALAKERFDLLITDQQMPHVEGSEICRRLRLMEGYSQTPIILVTAKGLELNQESLRQELGIAAVFAKPFSPSAIVQKAEACLNEYVANS
ncbi:MAG: response regulator [Planctomycetales bacterium]|nr:response regulator [Planctomycetales bacterium]